MNKKEVKLINDQLAHLRGRLGRMTDRYNSGKCSRQAVVAALIELNGVYRVTNILGERYFPKTVEVVLVNDYGRKMRISPFSWDKVGTDE